MKTAVAKVVKDQLSLLEPLALHKLNDARYNSIREAILKTEQDLRGLITGGEAEVHEWLAVIHYALADERGRLLGA